MKKIAVILFSIFLIGLIISGCEYKKEKKHAYVDSLFVKDSLLVFSNTYEPKSVWEDYHDTSIGHYPLDYLISMNERIQINKIKFLVSLERYNSLLEHIRKLPVLVVTGRQFRNELTGLNLTGDFVDGKFIATQTKSIIIPFGEYLDHKDDKYKYEVIDTMPKGYVIAGMTKSMIKKALGDPLAIITGTSKKGRLEQWAYDVIFRFDGTREKLKDKKFIYFLNDRAVSIKG